MANCQRIILNLIALLFSTFLTIKYVASVFLLYVFGKFPLKTCHHFRRMNFRLSCQKSLEKGKHNKDQTLQTSDQFIQLSDCLQSIIDSSISLCLTATLVNYNGYLAQGTLAISHHVHHSFLSLIYDGIPDYTKLIEESFNYFLIWAFILFGFFGITAQLVFCMDLINILTIPTKMIYALLRWFYSKLITNIGTLYEIISTNQTRWITCPYPAKYLTVNYRNVALMMLIILVQLTAFTLFYYIWLCMVVICLVALDNTLENAYIFFLRFGSYLCLLKKYKIKKQSFNPQNSMHSILEPQTAIRIIKGIDVFSTKNNPEIDYKNFNMRFSAQTVFNVFISIGKKNIERKASQNE